MSTQLLLFIQVWEKCMAGKWNLGQELLYSKCAKAAFQQYLQTGDLLWQEINAKIGPKALEQVLSDSQIPDSVADIHDNTNDGDEDDSDIPLWAIIEQEFGICNVEIPWSSNCHCVVGTWIDESGWFLPLASEENVWAYSSDGQLWEETHLPQHS
jgi:hypothetical protein